MAGLRRSPVQAQPAHGGILLRSHRSASRPVGEPKADDFRIEEYAGRRRPGPGEVLLRTIWLSLDPYMRGRMSDGPSYATPVPIGDVMEGGTVSEVIASNNPGFAKGDIVLSRAGWQTHAISDGKGLRKIDPKLAPISTAVGVLGMPGMTAYTGLLDIGKPQAGRDRGGRRPPPARSARRSARSRRSRARARSASPAARTNATTSRTSSASTTASIIAIRIWPAKLKAACPKGIDVYFENVGGAVFEAVFPLLNAFARMPVCGLIANYNDTEMPAGEMGPRR